MNLNKEESSAKDRFANIAAGSKEQKEQIENQDGWLSSNSNKKVQHEKILIEPTPPELSDVVLPCHHFDPDAAFTPRSEPDNSDSLHEELKKQKSAHAKYLDNLAPPPEQTRIRIPLEVFDWRLEKAEDIRNSTDIHDGCGSWKKVNIPHYHGPLGKAVSYYRNAFDINADMLKKGSVFICFKAVDYKAHVFVNGYYVGSHEGIFAPFEFDITKVVLIGKNTLLVRVENDAICMGNDWGPDKDLYEGDKICAAEGPGYNEPQVGWHVTPPGMGILQEVFVEARPPIFIHDIFIRPIPEELKAEAWVEIYSCHLLRHNINLKLSIYGQNFYETVFEDKAFKLQGQVGPGVNYYRFSLDLPDCRIWDVDNPWLYQAQVKVIDNESESYDVSCRQFGMRSFFMDDVENPKGCFYLNNRKIRLHGANVSGSIQLCVMKKDWNQLIEDILLAKACNMNFFRIIQRPVQQEVYDICDRLGILTQTDLPLFGVLRRNQYCEAIRQAEEMERLVRSHPCNVLVSYINEPFPNAMEKPHRHLVRSELESFFRAAGEAILLANPDRVIKEVDGDYDPPGPGYPDNHCYNGWYNGHGLDIGKLHKGYWQKVKPNWYYGCGEFGAEALDSVELMRKYCPEDWLPKTEHEERDWSPNLIPAAQTGRFHYLWFDSQCKLEDWVKASRDHQAWVLRIMIEAFRRDSRMNSFAVYYFIDSWPTGWMKSIMDVERNPKPAYFVCRDALTPLMVNLRTDRYSYFAGEEAGIEAWICNFLHEVPENTYLHYQLELEGEIVFSQRVRPDIPACSSNFQGHIKFKVPNVERRVKAVLRLALIQAEGKIIHDNSVIMHIFPYPVFNSLFQKGIHVIGKRKGKVEDNGEDKDRDRDKVKVNAEELLHDAGLKVIENDEIQNNDVILVDDYEEFLKFEKDIMQKVYQGATVVFLELPEGEYKIAGNDIKVSVCGMRARHFASRNTGHPIVEGFMPDDFKFWFDSTKGYVTPFLFNVFNAPDWIPILISGNGNWEGNWKTALVSAEKKYGEGIIRISQISLNGRIRNNPVAFIYFCRLVNI